MTTGDIPTLKADASEQLRVALAYVEVFNSGDVDAMAPLLSDELKHRTHPLSLGRPFRTKDEYLALLNGYGGWLKISVSEVNESPGKVWLHGFGRGTPPFGGTYENEYVHMLHISPGIDGVPRITEIKEFMDSVAINTLMERMQQAQSSRRNQAQVKPHSGLISRLYTGVVHRLALTAA